MPTDENEEEAEYNNHLLKDGKKDIGSIICL
jgi:hypothetical protein